MKQVRTLSWGSLLGLLLLGIGSLSLGCFRGKDWKCFCTDGTDTWFQAFIENQSEKEATAICERMCLADGERFDRVEEI